MKSPLPFSARFIRRPVGTSLLAIGLLAGGLLAFTRLPIAALPQVEFPTILVRAKQPGADPSTIASAVSAPLERRFAQIAGVDEINSSSYAGETYITLQFDLGRSIDRAAQDVQAAVDAARGELPSNLPTPPLVEKVNPSDQPIMILAMDSDTLPLDKVGDYALDVVSQRLQQVAGVGAIDVQGLGRSAVRVQVDPGYAASLGLGLEDFRGFLSRASVCLPLGRLDGAEVSYALRVNDQILTAAEYNRQIAFKGRNGWVRLGAVGRAVDSVENMRELEWYNGRPGTQLLIYKQPGANVIETSKGVREAMPEISRWLPPGIRIAVLSDRTETIRASLVHVELTLGLSILLVVAVVFLFLRRPSVALIPCLTVPLALAGTFAFMKLAGYTLDNLSVMALAVAIGLVVDDSIVVVEAISRRIEAGQSPRQAAEEGAAQIGPTLFGMGLSLVAVFTPLILMSGLVGRLLREFGTTLAAAVSISTVVSLTVTPMLCSRLRPMPRNPMPGAAESNRWESFLSRLQTGYGASLDWVLGHDTWVVGGTIGTMAGTAALYVFIPKGLFPPEDAGQFRGPVVANQATSIESMKAKQAEVVRIIRDDPAVAGIASAVINSGDRTYMFVSLKPLSERRAAVWDVVARLKGRLDRLPAATAYLQPVQELHIGSLYSSSTYQYTLQGTSWRELGDWAGRLATRLSALPHFRDVTTDLEFSGLESRIAIDHDAAGRLGLSTADIDNALYDAFGQRQVALNYEALAQHRVILEARPEYQTDPAFLKKIYLKAPSGKAVPLSAVARSELGNAALVVNHQGQFPSITVSFNINSGYSLSGATAAIEETMDDLHMPGSIRGSFQGSAKAFEGSLRSEILLVCGALLCVYLILGMLYESLVHPLAILSALPSAGCGALIALFLTVRELDMVGVVGIVLLIGIGAKNAILMVDAALQAERLDGMTPGEAITDACRTRFRPILMTTAAALFGILPLAVVGGVGSTLHRPLGIAVVGGLAVSQALTLYSTPAMYLALDRLRLRR